MDQALANWVPSGILAGVVILGLKWIFAKLEQKFDTLEANNKRSVNTVEGRVEAGLRYDNLFQRGHS